jgi:DNA-directed RNA polymerase subunit delta
VLAVVLEKYSTEEIQEMSMLDIALKILEEEKKGFSFQELYDLVAQIKGFTEEEKEEHLAQLYTDINVDGRLVFIDGSLWGLKRWYPMEQLEEEIAHKVPKKKKAKKKVEDDDFEDYGEDEDFDLEEDFDEDLDLDDEDLDDEEDEDFDEDLDDDEDLDFDDDFDESDDEIDDLDFNDTEEGFDDLDK